MKAKVLWRPAVVPSAREQYLDLAAYFEGQGEADLATFYRELANTTTEV